MTISKENLEKANYLLRSRDHEYSCNCESCRQSQVVRIAQALQEKDNGFLKLQCRIDVLEALERSVLDLSHPDFKLIQKDARNEALEEAAKIAETCLGPQSFGEVGDVIAKAIRKLKKD